MAGSTSTKKQAREVFNLGRFSFFREIFFSSSLTELKCVWKENLIRNLFVMIPVLVANTIKNGGGGGKGGGLGLDDLFFGYSLGVLIR